MIVALMLIYSALLFALGVIVGSIKRRGEQVARGRAAQSELNKEIFNFLSYDGTEQ